MVMVSDVVPRETSEISDYAEHELRFAGSGDLLKGRRSLARGLLGITGLFTGHTELSERQILERIGSFDTCYGAGEARAILDGIVGKRLVLGETWSGEEKYLEVKKWEQNGGRPTVYSVGMYVQDGYVPEQSTIPSTGWGKGVMKSNPKL
jgi:hypothetical protein